MSWRGAGAAVLLGLLSCAGCEPGAPDQACESSRDSYPGGPYGTQEGDVIAPHAFLTTAGEPFSLADVFADRGNELLLITTAAGWCTACIEEQPKLQALHEQYAARGLFVLVAYFEDESFQPASPADADGWRQRFALDPLVVADPDFAFADYYDASLTPLNLIVDVGCMSIVKAITGWDEAVVESIIDARL